ncbi:MAG TPA: PfkB family carbohydrate kinase [Dongiaceae bacterium]|nr:PfkB family carbohydrate kinase [Dongiaceae bacterium]
MTRTSSSTLVAIGDNCLDVYVNKDLMTTGGNALNVAVQWHRNGWNACYFGAVGTDPEADVLLTEIATAGLATADVERHLGETAVTLLRDEFGDRKILLESFGVGENYMPSADRYETARDAGWIHLGTNADKDLVRRLVADGIPFSIDVSTSHLALPLEGVPLVFASGPDEADVSVEPIVAGIKAAGAGQVVVTCGSRGAYFGDGGALLHTPAKPVNVVDTCGAGDSFIASFLTAFVCNKLGAAEALRKAAAAAAETCLHVGGFPQETRRIPAWLLSKYAPYITPPNADTAKGS